MAVSAAVETPPMAFEGGKLDSGVIGPKRRQELFAPPPTRRPNKYSASRLSRWVRPIQQCRLEANFRVVKQSDIS
jgi:hypothetical protein